MFDYTDLKSLAKAAGVRVTDLLVLAAANDPFYAGVPGRLERAEWFANIWQTFGFRQGAHLRRIHYVLVSQHEPIRWPDGTPYENTVNDWQGLVCASLGARYGELIPDAVLVDRRNPAPIITATFEGDPEPEIDTYDTAFSFELPSEFPVPELLLSGFRRDQDFLVEVWCEKSTMNDVLVPLSTRLGFNLVTGLGEMSETSARLVIDRAVQAGKPARLLYVSDFDPAGRSMPVAVARKIEFRAHQLGIAADIQLHPIALTPEQCVEYRLPRTPIKETERRAGRFEAMFGAGATELDAMEALHPGKLDEIVTKEVCRYLDPTLNNRIETERRRINRRLTEVDETVRERHAEQIDDLSGRYDDLLAEAALIEEVAAGLWATMEAELVGEAPYLQADDVPVPRDPDPIEEPLFELEAQLPRPARPLQSLAGQMMTKRGRKIDKTGRSIGAADKFVALRNGLRASAAWRSLSFAARCVYIEMAAGVYQSNNGQVARSSRFLADLVGTTRPTIDRALRDLTDRGFIICTEGGHLGPDGRGKPSRWRITEIGTAADPMPTKEYLKWAPEECKSPATQIGQGGNADRPLHAKGGNADRPGWQRSYAASGSFDGGRWPTCVAESTSKPGAGGQTRREWQRPIVRGFALPDLTSPLDFDAKPEPEGHT